MSDVAGVKMPHAHGSHDRHAGHSVAMFRDKFWLSFALTIPVVFWSTDVQRWLGYTRLPSPARSLSPLSSERSSSLWRPSLHPRAWGELADRKPGMMTLISLAIVVAFELHSLRHLALRD